MNWKATYDTPHVFLSLNNLSICGKSMMDDPYSFYQPVVKKVFYFQNDSLTIEIDVKRVNKVSKKQIFKILSTAKANPYIKILKVLWLRDPSNEDEYDFGKELESVTGLSFEYLDYA